MSAHSSIVGGSTAARVLACPGSVVATLALPKSVAVTSEYAEEGTFYHHVISALMEARAEHNNEDLESLAHAWVGQKFHDRILTAQHVYEGISPALSALAELEELYGGNFEVIAIERTVKFPQLQDVYGTVDLMLRNDSVMLHVDFKFGQGIPISVRYPDGTINAQLMFYIAAARATLRATYGRDDALVAAIIQPRIETKLSHAPVAERDLITFRQSLARAVSTALTPQAPRSRGEHCRFAPCKLTCPLWAGPLLDAGAFKLTRFTETRLPEEAYGRHLALAKQLVDMVSVLKTEVDNQLHTYLSNGGLVPGWRLKARNKNRQWIDETIVDRELRKLGFKPSEIWRKKLLTFEAADALAKRKRKKIPEHLRVAPPTSETTIASVDDPAPVVTPANALEQFRASLAQLVGPQAIMGQQQTGDRT